MTMIKVTREASFPIRSQNDIVTVRQIVRSWSIEQQFGIIDQTKIITGASELARNAYEYGKGGDLYIEALDDGLRKGLRLTFTDAGPGIPDLELAMTPGWTSGTGLGMGLSGTKRLVNEFELRSEVGKGTTVVVIKWK